MAKKGLTFEAGQLIDELKARVAEAQAEAKKLADREGTLLQQANTAAQSAGEVASDCKALEAEVAAIMPLLKILGLADDAKLALEALRDEADSLVAAAKEKQEELLLEAQLLWENNGQLKKLVEAERKAKAKRDEAEKRAFEAEVGKAEAALAEVDIADLVEKYPKRFLDAKAGKFPADPDDKRGMRTEMLKRALRGRNFDGRVVDAINPELLAEAEMAFRKAQTADHDRRQREKDGVDDSITAAAVALLVACKVPEDAIDLVAAPNAKGTMVLRGTVQGQRINQVVDSGGRWRSAIQKAVA